MTMNRFPHTITALGVFSLLATAPSGVLAGEDDLSKAVIDTPALVDP